jgi:hypothetical protein
VMGTEFSGVRVYDEAGTEVPPAREPAANTNNSVIAAGPAGELFVDDSGAGRVTAFEASGTQVSSFGTGTEESARGLAYGEEAQRLYALDEGVVRLLSLPVAGPIVEREEASAGLMGAVTLKALIDPEGKQTQYDVEYGPEGSATTTTTTVTMAGVGFEPETVEVKLTGLAPETAYSFRFIAANASAPAGNAGAEQTFTTLPAVGIESESASHVTASSARLETTLNPLGLASRYRFEYGPTATYGTSVPAPAEEGQVDAGVVGVPFSILVEALSPGTTYHYRLVAHNTFGETDGADHVFTTQAGEGSTLIDGRGWELVSPPDKHGAALEAMTLEGGQIQAAENGQSLAYIAKAPVDATPAGNRSFASQELLSKRTGSGWDFSDIASPHEGVAGLGPKGQSEYKLFSGDLSSALVEPEGTTPLSPKASERTPYMREQSACESTLEAVRITCWTPLADPEDVPEGTKFGLQEESGEWQQGSGVEFDTATPDFGHVVVNAPQALTAGSQAGGISEQNLFEWTRGASPLESLQSVGILENEASALTQGGARVGDEGTSMRNAVSANGSRIVFETSHEHHLFMREMSADASIQLDKPEPGVAIPNIGEALYQDASAEGERVFFTDSQKLTSDAGTEAGSQNEPDLYECEITHGAGGKPSCKLSDLTPVGPTGEPADVLGSVLGASQDGHYVYFVANGVLGNGATPVAGAVHGNCAILAGQPLSAAASCNLYEWHDGVIKLIAVVSNKDFPDWAGANKADLSKLTSRVSPDGGYLAFMSQRSLTGYDNRDAISGERDEEVFEYDARRERVVCVSCDPSGARPVGIRDRSSEQPALLVDRPFAWEEQWLAASVPGWTATQTGTALYQSRYLTDEGRLFFDSTVGLVPGDDNGKEDVYEFEPEGVGTCASSTSSATAVYVKQTTGSPVEGCIGLISSGTSGEESTFLDAGAKGPGGQEGEDVFFLTAAKLSSADSDDALDVYDAHICSTGAPCPASAVIVPPACADVESCRAAPTPRPEVFGSPSSATFSGQGNVTPAAPASKPKPPTRVQQLAAALKKCRKDKARKKRQACERQARKKYGTSAKKATPSRNRRTHK